MSWQVLDGWRWSFPDMPFSHVLTQPKSLSTSLAMNDEQGGSGGGRLWFWWSTLSCQVAKPTLPNSFLPKQTRADSGMWNDQKHSQVNPGSQPSESPCILKDNTSDLWTNFKLGYFCSCTCINCIITSHRTNRTLGVDRAAARGRAPRRRSHPPRLRSWAARTSWRPRWALRWALRCRLPFRRAATRRALRQVLIGRATY